MNQKSTYSKFWLEDDGHLDAIEKQILSSKELEARDTIKMASYRRAIANFVCILTGKQIPVIFYQKGDSLTDGKKVIISADFHDKDFDPTVGLALHEGAHIVKSDFLLLKDLASKIPTKIFDSAKTKGLDDKKEVTKILQLLLNYVEDRYIDDYIYSSAPGYRGYYVALYNKYFHSAEVDEGLRSSSFRDEDIDSYFFRLINLTNNSTNLNALKGLAEIEKILDLKTISRLKNPKDRLNLSFDIARIIFNCIDIVDKSKKKPEKSDDKGEQGQGDSDGEGETIDLTDEDIDGMTVGDPGEKGKGDSGEGKKIKKIRLTQEQLEKLMKKIQEQKDFLGGEVKKQSLTSEEQNEMQSIEDSGTDLVVVGRELKGTFSSKGVECIVVKKMTDSVINSPSFPFKADGIRGQKYVREGIRIGTLLGRKLQIRGESRDTKYLRQNSGRIEKRLINSLGYDYERVFSQVSISKYKKAALHLSVDGSGSMADASKWEKTMTCVVAMCKAASMIENLRIVVSFRSCNAMTSTTPRPYIVIAYDSLKDKFSKVKSLFSKLGAHGSTPEGLSFEAILKLVPPSNAECDSYFLNLSDGEPCFGRHIGGESFQYSGDEAARHTRKQVEKFRQEGIRVLSYFIESRGYGRGIYGSDENASRRAFKTMYGADARFIDITNVIEIAKTMNERFLEK